VTHNVAHPTPVPPADTAFLLPDDLARETAGFFVAAGFTPGDVLSMSLNPAGAVQVAGIMAFETVRR